PAKLSSGTRCQTGRHGYPCAEGGYCTSGGRSSARWGTTRSAAPARRRHWRFGNASLPSDPGTSPCPNDRSAKEILAKPDPALGYYNGELRFWLGWAQEVGGDHAAAQETWRRARNELESFLKEQPDNFVVIGDLALTCMGLGAKSAAFTLSQKSERIIPLEKDALHGPSPIEILALVTERHEHP